MHIKLEPQDGKAVTFAELRELVQAAMRQELPDDTRFIVTTYRFTGLMSSISTTAKKPN